MKSLKTFSRVGIRKKHWGDVLLLAFFKCVITSLHWTKKKLTYFDKKTGFEIKKEEKKTDILFDKKTGFKIKKKTLKTQKQNKNNNKNKNKNLLYNWLLLPWYPILLKSLII